MSDLKNLPDWSEWILQKKANEDTEKLMKSPITDDTIKSTVKEPVKKTAREEMIEHLQKSDDMSLQLKLLQETPAKKPSSKIMTPEERKTQKERIKQKHQKKFAQTMQAQANWDKLYGDKKEKDS